MCIADSRDTWGFRIGSVSKQSACHTGDPSSVPESERSPGEGNGYPLQYSCLENPMHTGAWRATVPGVPKSQTRLSEQRSITDSLCRAVETYTTL